MVSVLIDIHRARRGEPSIELRLDHTRFDPGEAFELGREAAGIAQP